MGKGVMNRAAAGLMLMLMLLLMLVAAAGFIPAERGNRAAIWTPLGPAGLRVLNPTSNASAILSGRVDIAVSDPRDANVMYVGTNSGGGSPTGGGGIWKTANYLTTDPAGPTWVPLTDDFPSLTIYGKSLALYRDNPDILYGAASGPNGGI
jgi:hypothetical protein